MKRHIQDFEIHAYKGIHDLKLNNLNCINILTGDNNSGKTSVLELLSTLQNPQNTDSWVTATRMGNSAIRNRLFFNGFYNMFPIDDDEKVIGYNYVDSNGESKNIRLSADIEQMQISEKEMYRINGLRRTESSKEDNVLVDTTCMHLNTYINNQKVKEDNIFEFQTMLSKNASKKKQVITVNYVSPVEHATNFLYLNDILSDSELYEELIRILKEFDEDIISVNALKRESFSFSSEYMILTKKHEKALPLNSYGDGMKKAMLLLSAIVKSKDGIVLLDEFETAIHTSAMNSVFTLLLKSALKLNVQVFLTSHSKEAIEKVLKSDEELQPYINLYTLYDYKGKNYVRMMGCKEAIKAQEKLGLELR